MKKFTAVTALISAVGILIAQAAPQSAFGILREIGLLGLAVSLLYYGFKFFQWLKKRLLWKVRNKIIISYAFVGIIPVAILAIMAAFSLSLIFRQLSVVYLENEFEQAGDLLEGRLHRVVLRFYQGDSQNQERLLAILKQERESFAQLYPDLAETEFLLLKKDVTRDSTTYDVVTSAPSNPRPVAGITVPPWAREGFNGLASENQRVSYRSLLPVRAVDRQYLVYVAVPLDEKLIGYIRTRTSMSLVDVVEATTFEDFYRQDLKFFEIRSGYAFNPALWSHRVNLERTSHVVLLTVPLQTIFRHYFTESGVLGKAVLPIVAGLVLIFLLVELVSLIIGVAIARSITRSIHNIYAGSRNIQAGNFDFRIPAGDRDQLDSMATAFNHMSESIVTLMNQVTEKERLDKEIEIAREVQAHLFPRDFPTYSQLQLAGTCLPARMVSGDYFDFIPLLEERLDIVISDISGKGISAALLMANLQSSIRSHIAYYGAGTNGDRPIARAVGAINRQLYTHTSPDKFATLVLARVDTKTMTLTYCNAGHNPPLILSRESIHKLSTGGIVAGLFESPDYEEATIQLHAQDVVLFYTDGVVEAENPAGEQFGDAQLEHLLRSNAFLTADDIRGLIIDEITNWAQGREQHDDITVVVMKVADHLQC